MQAWLKRLVPIKKVAGVRIQVKGDDTVSYGYCVLEKRGSQVTMVSSEEIAGLKEIKEFNLPLCLVIDGTGVVSKSLSWISESDVTVEDVLPGSDTSQFCFSSYRHSGMAYISIARRSLVGTLTQPFLECHVISVAIGPQDAIRTFDLMGKEETIFTSGYSIAKMSGRWRFGEIQEGGATNYDCSGIAVNKETLQCFSSALQCLLFPGEPASAVSVQDSQERYYRETLLGQGIIAFGVILFIGLIINFVAFSVFSTRHEKLRERIISLGGSYQKTDSLERELESKKEFLRQSGWMTSSEQSYYADQLAATRPDGLIWTQLNIHPRYKTDNETYAFQGKSIRIKGEVKDVFDLNTWQKKLAGLSWIDKTELEYLKKNDETLYSDFSLFIAIK